MQFTKELDVTVPGQSQLAGTQTIDRCWDHLDRYLPREVNSAIKINGRTAINPLLWTYMYSWRWRTNVELMQQDLFQALGDLVQRL